MTDLHETEAWKKMEARVDAEIAAEGGSTGSNMADASYLPPEAHELWKNTPPEEKKALLDFIRS